MAFLMIIGHLQHHSTGTALVKGTKWHPSEYRCRLNNCTVAVALDTVDRNILLDGLENWVGLSGTGLSWFRSYLKGRSYFGSISTCKSENTKWSPTRIHSWPSPISSVCFLRVKILKRIIAMQMILAVSASDFSSIDSVVFALTQLDGSKLSLIT